MPKNKRLEITLWCVIGYLFTAGLLLLGAEAEGMKWFIISKIGGAIHMVILLIITRKLLKIERRRNNESKIC